MSKLSFLFSIFVAFATLVSSAQAKRPEGKEASPSERSAMVTQLLKKDSGSVLIYTKGLVCKSCAIGIRKHISKVKGVDRSRGKKGVLLDVNHQLVQVFTDQGVNAGELAEAIRDAGYLPVKAYRMKGKKLVEQKL